jgi:DNA-binding MarR family transcriptional regulator
MADQDPLITAVRSLARVSRVIERASDGLSLADYRVLATISSGEERASRLADRLAVGKPAISATVDSLAKRGLILRAAVEGDARATSLALSEEGAELFARMEARMARQLELLAERTDDPDRVIASLGSLGDALEQALEERRQKAEA